MPQPIDYNLPHDKFRTYQHQAIMWAMDEHIANPSVLDVPDGHEPLIATSNGSMTKILQGPTGSGKTGIATALQKTGRICSLCESKALQRTNYEESYSFHVLMGRGNYPCSHPDQDADATAADCLHIGQMHNCDYASSCEYLQLKEEAMSANAVSLNYPYWLTSRWPRRSTWEWVILDEAHRLSEIVLDWAGCTISERERKDWNLPPFPRIIRSRGSVVKVFDPLPIAIKWIASSVSVLSGQEKRLRKQANLSSSSKKLHRKCERLLKKLEATQSAIEISNTGWFIRSGIQTNGYPPKFNCRPLSARNHFDSYFPDSYRMLGMSATIGGTPDPFARELGITSFDWLDIPDQYPPDQRPIYDLGAPGLGRKATPKDHAEQARLIAAAIRECPPDWCGVIHVVSKYQAQRLAQNLARYGLDDRIWVTPEGSGTDEMMELWELRKRERRGSLCISWALWMGVDLVEERIDIIGKVPFPYLGDDYERERMQTDGMFYLLRTAWMFQQGAGRTRRTEDDYDTDGRRNNLVAIADGNWTRVQKHLASSFRKAIVKWK